MSARSFHAGTAGMINGPAGGVLFSYGGAPRKMLPAVAVFFAWLLFRTLASKSSPGATPAFDVLRDEGHLVPLPWRSEKSPAKCPAAGV
ncbi:MAG: hypothetical protein U1G07_21795 [Verrucomicrobiota bacterium]